MQRVKEFTIKENCFFQRKTIDGSVFLVFEPSKNRPCIDKWRGVYNWYSLSISPTSQPATS
jgi:hypothetical protein